MPVPDLEDIQEMGRKVLKSRDYSEANCNLILEGYCGEEDRRNKGISANNRYA